VLGALALACCLATVACAVAGPARAATNWTVARAGAGGGTGQAEPLPAAPGGVDAACVSLVGWTIKVSWNSVPHASAYTIYRSTTSGTSGFSAYTTVGGGTTSYSDSNFSVLTSYWYRVTATVGTNWTGPQSASSPRRSISLLLVCT
jgi:hypothetical protein